MPCRCKTCCIIFSIIFVNVALLSSSLYIYFTNNGGKETLQALDSLVITHGLSSYWCREVSIVAEDDSLLFNASVIPGQPMTNPSIRQKSTADLTLSVAQGGNAMLRYFLPATSVISIMQCASQPFLMSYIFKGHDLIDECIKLANSLRNQSLAKYTKGHDPCNEIILGRELVLVCRSGRLQPLKANIAIDDFYIIYYNNLKSDDADVTMKLTIERPTYDMSKRTAFCTYVTNCTLPLKWGSGDTVILQTGTGAHSSIENNSVTYKCHSNYIAYLIIFVCIPFSIILSITLTCYLRNRRKNRTDRNEEDSSTRPILHESVEEERSYFKEDERLQHSYGSINPINAVLSSVPGSSVAPSAPLPEPFIPDNHVFPYLPREPPPTYEDSVNDNSAEYRHPMKC